MICILFDSKGNVGSAVCAGVCVCAYVCVRVLLNVDVSKGCYLSFNLIHTVYTLSRREMLDLIICDGYTTGQNSIFVYCILQCKCLKSNMLGA